MCQKWCPLAQSVERLPAWSHIARQRWHDRSQFQAPPMPVCRHMDEKGLTAMLAVKKSAGVTPKWSRLFEAFLECFPYLVYLLTVLNHAPRVSQQLYASSPPATSMRAHCLSSGTWSATKITFIRRLKSFHVATLSAALQFISGYFSLGMDGMIPAIRWSFQDHEGKLNESYLWDNWR